MRVIGQSEYCHERLGQRFAEALSDYDTQRRVEVLIQRFLGDATLAGKQALDVGCGFGFFSQALQDRGARVTACDLGPGLVAQTRSRVDCDAVVADALELVNQFGPQRFDVVVSSECIEHTPSPTGAIRQMAGVLKSGGLLSISTPNLVWQPIVRAATRLKLRPFDGYENFSSWRGLRRALDRCGIDVIGQYGLHLIPFQFRLHRTSRWLDRHLQAARPWMINICILGRKRINHMESTTGEITGGGSDDAQSRVA